MSKRRNNRQGREGGPRGLDLRAIAESTIGKTVSTVDAVKTVCMHQFRQNVLRGQRVVPLMHPALPAVHELAERPAEEFLQDDWPRFVQQYVACMSVKLTPVQRHELSVARAVVHEVGEHAHVNREDCRKILAVGDEHCEAEGIPLSMHSDHPLMMLGSTINMGIRRELARRKLLQDAEVFALFPQNASSLSVLARVNDIGAEILTKLGISYGKRLKEKGWQYDASNPFGWLN